MFCPYRLGLPFVVCWSGRGGGLVVSESAIISQVRDNLLGPGSSPGHVVLGPDSADLGSTLRQSGVYPINLNIITKGYDILHLLW